MNEFTAETIAIAPIWQLARRFRINSIDTTPAEFAEMQAILTEITKRGGEARGVFNSQISRTI